MVPFWETYIMHFAQIHSPPGPLLYNALVLLKKPFPAQILALGPHRFFNA